MNEALTAQTVMMKSQDGHEVEAYLARPDGVDSFGGVVVIHHLPGYDSATKEIARSLEITVHTARTHSQRVLEKLGAHSRLEASGMAARRGWAGPSGERALSRVSEQAGFNR